MTGKPRPRYPPNRAILWQAIRRDYAILRSPVPTVPLGANVDATYRGRSFARTIGGVVDGVRGFQPHSHRTGKHA